MDATVGDREYTEHVAETTSPYPYLTVDEYLALEETATTRHEYVDGQLYAFAGASIQHNRIIRNLIGYLTPATDGTGCEVLFAEVKLRVASNVFYYPDLLVVCDPEDQDPLYRTSACLVVAVLSASTETVDRREKLFAYRQMPDLQAYVLVFQDERRVQRHIRDEQGRWANTEVAGSGIVPFPCPRIELTLDQIYAGVI